MEETHATFGETSVQTARGARQRPRKPQQSEHAERVPTVPVSEERRQQIHDLAERLHPIPGRSISIADTTNMVLEVGLAHLDGARVAKLPEIVAERTGSRP